jgi:hypothetical protein
MALVNNTYEHKLACAYWRIDNRGLDVNTDKIKALKKKVITERQKRLDFLSLLWGIHVYVGAENKPSSGDSLNLNATSGKNTLLAFMQKQGFKIPKVRKKDNETLEYEWVESAEELALRRGFAEETDPNRLEAYKAILDIREFNTLTNRYLNARLHNSVYYCNYNVAGTVTGRRSCRKTCFGLGGNAQNFPKHYDLGHEFMEAIEARPGHIFFIVDQMQAEDWPVSALSENYKRLDMLKATNWPDNDGHTQLASFIFGIPITSRTKKEWKDSIERYLGKKCRHAYNYGMREQMMSDSLAKEGKNIAPEQCKWMLQKVGNYDPSIDNVFHAYIRNQVFTNKRLITPFGRERIFFGLRQNDANYKILNEAYSWIPQSLVGDNTGLAILELDKVNTPIVNESHDSITSEVENNWESLVHVFTEVEKAFDRTITFHNGISVKIPIEGEIGFNLNNTIKLEKYTIEELRKAYEKLCTTTQEELSAV